MEYGNREMRNLIQMIDQLRDAYRVAKVTDDINLPQIVAIGGQSAGKSSVLENFVGRDFLPRGKGVVTRTPIILQLHTSERERVELNGKEFTRPDEMKAEIEKLTKLVAGSAGNIVDRPITIKMCAPTLLNITMVDLPGMTKVPVGDQPPDIAEQLKTMVRKYIEPSNTLILAVSPANADLATSDAMQMAREVDPEGNRTIGVITKLDMMDKGTDAADVLQGKVVPLKLGYVGVVNRSQKDISQNVDIKAAIFAERTFFESEEPYCRMDLPNVGTEYLQKTLSEELKHHIFRALPGLKKKLTQYLHAAQEKQEIFEDVVCPEKAKRRLMKCIRAFKKNVEVDVEGWKNDVDTTEVATGPRINRLFYDDFARMLELRMMPAEDLEKEIATAITNIRGISTELFTPDQAFRRVVKKVVESFRTPVKECVDMVSHILDDSVNVCAKKQILVYMRLREEVLIRVLEHLSEQQDEVKNYLMKYIDAEVAFQNIRHEDMIKRGKDKNLDPSPKYIKSVPTLRRDLRNRTNLHSGRIKMMISSEGDDASEDASDVEGVWFWAVLRHNILLWSKRKTKTQTAKYEGAMTLTPRAHFEMWSDTLVIRVYDGIDAYSDDFKTCLFQCNDECDFKRWVACLRNAGLRVDNEVGRKSDTETSSSDEDDDRTPRHVYGLESSELHKQTLHKDPDLAPQVLEIKVMVLSYLKIVNKNVRDMVPKYIVHILVNGLLTFIREDLVDEFLAHKDPKRLLEDGGEAQREYDECEQQIRAVKNGLMIIENLKNRPGLDEYFDADG